MERFDPNGDPLDLWEDVSIDRAVMCVIILSFRCGKNCNLDEVRLYISSYHQEIPVLGMDDSEARRRRRITW